MHLGQAAIRYQASSVLYAGRVLQYGAPNMGLHVYGGLAYYGLQGLALPVGAVVVRLLARGWERLALLVSRLPCGLRGSTLSAYPTRFDFTVRLLRLAV